MLPTFFDSNQSNLFYNFFEHFPFFGYPTTGSGSQTWNHPQTNFHEDKTNFYIEVAIPGMEKKDVRIELDNQYVHVYAEKTQEKTEGEHYRHIASKFQRSFSLPENVSKKAISGKVENGILTITCPKTEPTESKKIEIKIS